MHGPFWITCVFPAVHYDLAQAAADTALLYSSTEAVKTVAISKLRI
jgi:hypothetical protein